jgi:hypothetical protein
MDTALHHNDDQIPTRFPRRRLVEQEFGPVERAYPRTDEHRNPAAPVTTSRIIAARELSRGLSLGRRDEKKPAPP